MMRQSPEREGSEAGGGEASHEENAPVDRAATLPGPSAQEDLSGRTWAARYALEQRIGAGPVGTTYRARDLESGGAVAVKVLDPRFGDDPHVSRRFLREAEHTQSLDHPNIARVLDFGTEAGRAYLCTEWCEGVTISEAVRGRPLTLKRILTPLCELLSALSSAQRKGVIHGCIKPSNVLVRETPEGAFEVKVRDFGMGRLLKPVPGTGRTKQGDACGVAEYMAPEQVAAGDVDGRADVYAVGVILYELLTDRVPHRATSYAAVLEAQCKAPPEPPRRVRPERAIPQEVENICLRALEKSPAERYPSPMELARALRAALDLLGLRAELALDDPKRIEGRMHTVSKDRLTMPGEQLRSRHKLGLGAALLLLVCAVVWFSAPRDAGESRGEEAASAGASRPGERELEAGRRKLSAGAVPEAVELLNRAREELGDTPLVLRWLGEALYRGGQPTEGRALLERYLQTSPQAPDSDEVEALLSAQAAPSPPSP